MATWSIPLGILIFMIAVGFAIYYYTTYKKYFLIFFIASVATYIFSVFYTWDVFDLNQNFILALLAFSVLIMFYLGNYFNSIELKKFKPSKK